MKAIAVRPGVPGSIHLADLPAPSLQDVPDGRGVLVRVIRVGVDGTDKEINAAEYGAAPPGYDFLVIGHESFGQVVAVGPAVTELAPGDFVVATVRRPGQSLYDRIGTYDMTTDSTYMERGINLLHGYLTEYYVDSPEYLVKVPGRLERVAVLLEPCSVIEKGIAQGYEIQRRLKVWQPRRAAVLGAGTIGLLAAMALRLRGLEVTVFGRTRRPYLNSDLLEAIGARYLSTEDAPLLASAEKLGPFDFIFEASGFSPLAFEAMEALGRNGVLVLSGVTGGDRTVEIPADRINLSFVLGNKVMVGTVNANREYFEKGVRDMALAEAMWPGWLSRLLTHPVQGLERYQELIDTLTTGTGVIKCYCEVALANAGLDRARDAADAGLDRTRGEADAGPGRTRDATDAGRPNHTRDEADSGLDRTRDDLGANDRAGTGVEDATSDRTRGGADARSRERTVATFPALAASEDPSR